MSEQRQSRNAGILRLPGRALDSHPNDESDRVNVRDGEVENQQDEELWEPENHALNGLQTDENCRSKLAKTERIYAARGHYQRGKIPEMVFASLREISRTQLWMPYTRFDHSSQRSSVKLSAGQYKQTIF